jgi:Protein of unknown function (DUF3775)
MLVISPEKIFFVIVKAREFAAKDALTDPEPSSSSTDDRMLSVLEDQPDDPAFDEVHEFINALSEDEQVDLVALAWLGRGEYTADDWVEVRGEAADAHNERTAEYLLGMPLLPDYLEEGLEVLDISLDDYEIGRL